MMGIPSILYGTGADTAEGEEQNENNEGNDEQLHDAYIAMW